MIKEYNYYEINAYCKSEGLNTEFFITNFDEKKKLKNNKLLSLILSAVTN